MKFEDMNIKQLKDKGSELSEQLHEIEEKITSVNGLLGKICDIAEFDPELCALNAKELKSLGLKVPIAIINKSDELRQLKTEKEKINGMICAVDYYINIKTNSDG